MISEDQKYVDFLEEEIYSADKKAKIQELNKQMDGFINELVTRRREDPYEGGLQAGMIIYPEAFAAKVNEEDGYGPHGETNINLTKFINHDHEYLSPIGMHYPLLYQNESIQLIEYGIEIRILDGLNELSVIITSACNNLSLFQLKVLRILIFKCQELMKKKIYQNVNVGIHTKNSSIDFGEWSEKKYFELLEAIDKEDIKMNI